MLKQTYQGQVTTGEWKALALHDPAGAELGPRPVVGVGRFEVEGAYFRSRRQDADLQVEVQVHSSKAPFPEGWSDVLPPITAIFPSRRAWLYGPPGYEALGRQRIDGIELPSDRVWIHAAVNGLDAEDAAQERWLILVWPNRSPFHVASQF
ncbi:hypothetical protein [Kineococcus sp. R86509]|uniref:hypothetical protein n=1 Tax=Kineococcus sp. R86509 TaxID=3093851 RepID=UPI0036D378F2